MNARMKCDNECKVVIDHVEAITNGSCEDLRQVPPDTTGLVKNGEGEVVSKITPLMMVVNQGGRDWKLRYRALLDAGHDPHKSVDYYGKQRSATDLIRVNHSGPVTAA